jgi:chromosome segregation ATPase
MLSPSVPHVPLTPMMDFLQRRLDSLERELSVEREKARSAQSQIEQQEILRSDVESHLKAMTEQLRREKAEREGQEMQSHARGRIDSLEKRLDDMHQSWAGLLKDAVTQRETGSQAVSQQQSLLKSEVASLSGVISGLMEQIGQWRAETQAVAKLLPEFKSLREDIPEGSRRFEGQVSQMLTQFSTDMRERMAAWERHQELEAQRLSERLRLLAQERDTMQRSWEEQNHAVRQEQLKERTARESEVENRIVDLTRKFEEMLLAQHRAASESGLMKDDLSKAVTMLTTPPKAKDQVISSLELERLDLLKSLQDRTQALQRFMDERRHIEKTMGDSLAALHHDLDVERENQRLTASRFTELEFENAKLRDQTGLHGRDLAEKDERHSALASQRDDLAKALSAESERMRVLIEERGLTEESWRAKVVQMEQRITAEIELRARESTVVSELRTQLTTLTEHLTKSLQEKEQIAARHSTFEQQQHKLNMTIQEKDEMISMLNAAFQNMLKKS